MKTAAALALCLVATAAATSDDEQAQARARLLLQRAVERVRAGVEQGVQGRAPAATAGAGGARRLAGSDHVGVISRAVYPESDTTCATTPMRWDVEMPTFSRTANARASRLTGTHSRPAARAPRRRASPAVLPGAAPAPARRFDTTEVTDDACAPNYDASYSYSYSFSYGDLDGYAKWGCEAIPAADVAATVTFYGLRRARRRRAQELPTLARGLPRFKDRRLSVKYSCDATYGFHVEGYTSSDCSGSPTATMTLFQVDTCIKAPKEEDLRVRGRRRLLHLGGGRGGGARPSSHRRPRRRRRGAPRPDRSALPP